MSIIYIELSLQLTFAGLHALKPCVIKGGVADIAAFAKPSTAASTTTEFAGFLGTALGALIGIYHGCLCRRGCFCRRTCGRCKVTTDTIDAGTTMQSPLV